MDQYVFRGRNQAFDRPAQTLLRSGNFPSVRDDLIDGLLRLFENNHMTNRLILEEGRYMSYLTVIALHASQDINNPATWLTLGRLQREVTELGFASRNRVEAQVSSLKKYGLLAQQPQFSDRRVRLLQPTEKMLARDATVLTLQMKALRQLDPDINVPEALSNDLHRAIRRESLANLESIGRLIRRHTPLAPFLEHDCGYMIMLLLLQSARHDDCATTCYQRLAGQTGVSRTHVRRLLEAVQESGLLSLNGRGGHDIRLSAQMWKAADLWFSQNLALLGYLIAEAGRRRQSAAMAA